MARPKIDLRRVLIPTDGIAIFVILLGFFIAIFLQEWAIRLIGISLAVLGSVGFFVLISQRISEMVETKHTPKQAPENIRVVTKKDQAGTRQVFEGFEESFGHEAAVKADSKKDDDKGDDGFRLIKKTEKEQGKTAERPVFKQPPTEAQSARQVESVSTNEYFDEVSGVRILRKFKADSQPVQEKKEPPKPITKEEIPPETQKEIIPEPVKADIVEEIVEEKAVAPEPVPPMAMPAAEEVKERTAAKSIPEPKLVIEFKHEPVPEEPKPQKLELKEEVKPRTEEKPAVATPQGYIEKEIDVQLNVLIDDMSAMGNEPRKEFDYFLERVLMAIRSVTNTRTACFIMINAEKGEMIIESKVTDVQKEFSKVKKIKLGNDIISQIYLNKKPEIVTEINPSAELDLIPYYTRSVKTSSFIGVPVFFHDAVMGVLCADTNVSDAYDAFTVGFFGQFTKLISALVQSYTDKFDLMQNSKSYDSLSKLRYIVNQESNTVEDIEQALVETASAMVSCHTVGICGFDLDKGDWMIRVIKSKNDEYLKLSGRGISLADTLVGRSISEGRSLLIAPYEQSGKRICADEPELNKGYFIAVPIPLSIFKGTYGAIFIEGDNPTLVSQFDLEIIANLCDHAAAGIEKLHLINMIQSSAIYDSATGIYNYEAFMNRLNEEMHRSSEFNLPFALSTVGIDKYASFDPEKYPKRYEKVLIHVIDHIRKNLKDYDILGRIGEDKFAVILVGADGNRAQLWCDKLKKEIASSVLDSEGKKFNVTISQGLIASGKAFDAGALINNSMKVLEKALEKKNSVSIYS